MLWFSKQKETFKYWDFMLEDTYIRFCVGSIIFLFSRSVMSDSLQSPGLQHTRLPCPSPFPGVYTNLCLLSQ